MHGLLLSLRELFFYSSIGASKSKGIGSGKRDSIPYNLIANRIRSSKGESIRNRYG